MSDGARACALNFHAMLSLNVALHVSHFFSKCLYVWEVTVCARTTWDLVSLGCLVAEGVYCLIGTLVSLLSPRTLDSTSRAPVPLAFLGLV